jgi:hypothetical protein
LAKRYPAYGPRKRPGETRSLSVVLLSKISDERSFFYDEAMGISN